MEIICKKEVDLISYNTVTELKKYCERKDIGSFLRVHLDSNGPLHKKIKKNLLTRLELIDENYELTDLGRECKETNKLWLKEKGEYTFTEIEDPLLNKIIDINPKSNSNIKTNGSSNKSLPQENIYSIKNSDRIYKISKKESISCEIHNSNEKLDLNLIFKEEEDNGIFKIDSSNKNIDRDSSGLEFPAKYLDKDILVKEVLRENSFNWNSELQVLEVTYEEALKEKVKNNIENNIVQKILIENVNNSSENNFYKFKNVEFSNIEIMPKNEVEAKKWYLGNITEKLKENYITPKNFDTFNNKEIRNRYFQHFSMEKLSAEEILNKLKKDHNTREYWNLKAPMDLRLGENIFIKSNRKNINRNLVIGKNNQKKSIQNLISEITPNTKDIVKVLLFDQHVLTDSKKEKTYLKFKYKFLNTFIQALGDDIKLDVYTKESSRENLKFIEGNNKNNNITFQKNEAQDKHPRNLIFIYEDSSYDIWRLDRTIDLITYDDNNFTKDTVGNSRNFSIHNMHDSSLDTYTKLVLKEVIEYNG